MDFTKIPLIRLMSSRLQWLGQRQQVLSQNVVNVDTPGYHAKDLKEGSFRQVLAGEITRPVMKVTHAGHIKSSRSSGAAEVVERRSEDGRTGKPVTVETEMMRVSETAMDYQVITNLYRRQVAMIRTALGRGGS